MRWVTIASGDSDIVETSGSDDGADLVDFVVADNQATSSMLDSQATSPPSAASQSTPRNRDDKPFFVPTRFSATQDSEGIPDVAALFRTRGHGRRDGSGNHSSEESEDLTARRTVRRRRRLVDMDSDE